MIVYEKLYDQHDDDGGGGGSSGDGGNGGHIISGHIRGHRHSQH